jgi:hypothetical protein
VGSSRKNVRVPGCVSLGHCGRNRPSSRNMFHKGAVDKSGLNRRKNVIAQADVPSISGT